MSDPASLQNLHDIVPPAAVPFWPPAPGWFLLAALAAVLLFAWSLKRWRRWRRNRYRTEALRAVARMRRDGAANELSELPVLLKRAALSAWPREQVAALHGAEWFRFLDRTAGTQAFSAGAGVTLERLAYGTEGEGGVPRDQAEAALAAAEQWLRRHRVPAETD